VHSKRRRALTPRRLAPSLPRIAAPPSSIIHGSRRSTRTPPPLPSFPLPHLHYKAWARAPLHLAPLLFPASSPTQCRPKTSPPPVSPRRRSAPPAPLPPFRAPRWVLLALLFDVFPVAISAREARFGRSPAIHRWARRRLSPCAAVRRRLSASSCCPPSIARWAARICPPPIQTKQITVNPDPSAATL
jgi:hypothetical protein